LVEVDDEHSSILVDVIRDGVCETHGIGTADSAASIPIIITDGEGGRGQV
jgi:hypothetical protein